jgi:endonuclease YncB( thermonuclease family)
MIEKGYAVAYRDRDGKIKALAVYEKAEAQAKADADASAINAGSLWSDCLLHPGAWRRDRKSDTADVIGCRSGEEPPRELR